jgi:hypothetical protein
MSAEALKNRMELAKRRVLWLLVLLGFLLTPTKSLKIVDAARLGLSCIWQSMSAA